MTDNKVDLNKHVAAAMREDLLKAEKDIKNLQECLKETENKALGAASELKKSLMDREALYNAVRVLAAELDNSTFSRRRAREVARGYLEELGIPPPHTLGSSRIRKSKKKRVLTKQ